ncbi:MAG: TIGR04086 family membrane protein [Clostridiales bacterium]|nr:TIGR04086 family membrane protein [Clostridiales bacterium]
MSKKPSQNRGELKLIKTIAFSSIIGIVISIFVLFLLAILMTKIDMPPVVISAISLVGLCIGALFAGIIAGRINRKDGILIGLICGGTVFAILAFIGIALMNSDVTMTLVVKLCAIVASSILGSVVGVNLKRRRY